MTIRDGGKHCRQVGRLKTTLHLQYGSGTSVLSFSLSASPCASSCLSLHVYEQDVLCNVQLLPVMFRQTPENGPAILTHVCPRVYVGVLHLQDQAWVYKVFSLCTSKTNLRQGRLSA